MRKIFVAIILIIIASIVYADEQTNTYGTKWNQKDATLEPAPDICCVDFSNITSKFVFQNMSVGNSNIVTDNNTFTNITVTDTAYISAIELTRSADAAPVSIGLSSSNGLAFLSNNSINYTKGAANIWNIDTNITSPFGANGPQINSTPLGASDIIYGVENDATSGLAIPSSQVDLVANDLSILEARTSMITFSRYPGIRGTDVLTVNESGDVSLTAIVVSINADMSAPDINAMYNSTTIFQPITSFRSFTNTSGIVPSLETNDITIQSVGDYFYSANMIVGAEAGTDVTLAVFVNATSNRGSTAMTYDDTGHLHHPVFLNISTGTLNSGTVADLENEDGTVLKIDEINLATPGFVFDLIYNSEVINPFKVDMRGIIYVGSATHEVEIQQYNYVLGRYTGLRPETMDFPDSGGDDAWRFYNRTFTIPQPRENYKQDNEAKTRIIHTSTGGNNHTFQIDLAGLIDDHNNNSISVSGILRGLQVGDVVNVQHKVADEQHLVILHNLKLNLIKVGN